MWREALWLVRDGYASTAEIDDAIRYGFGLRWAQMGLFETYRIAGGEGGMAHFVEQFRAVPVVALDKARGRAGAGPTSSSRASPNSRTPSRGTSSVRELERVRDDNLVVILRALKGRGAAAGALIAAHESTLPPPGRSTLRDRTRQRLDAPAPPGTFETVRRTVPIDWTDYNGHMNEGRYGQLFSDAADAVLARVGCGADYVASGRSWFTAETTVRYLGESFAGEAVRVLTRVTLAAGRKLRLVHEMHRPSDDEADVLEDPLATCEQFLLHVDLGTRKSCDPTRRSPAVWPRF